MQQFSLATVIGARPQFIKAAVVSRAISRYPSVEERLIHTGQPYDAQMSDVFFEELEIPVPSVNLGIGNGPHGQQTARMLEGLEQDFLQTKPDWVMLYGDTNSTLYGVHKVYPNSQDQWVIPVVSQQPKHCEGFYHEESVAVSRTGLTTNKQCFAGDVFWQTIVSTYCTPRMEKNLSNDDHCLKWTPTILRKLTKPSLKHSVNASST